MVYAEFTAGVPARITFVRTVSTRDWNVNERHRTGRTKVPHSELEQYLQPTKYVPTDGIVRRTAAEITNGAGTDMQKAKAIYEWVVENTYRKPSVRGCGNGNIRGMLESGDLGGKCADLNALFVGLARAAGLPARDVYGIRTGLSREGASVLGISSEDATSAQHCRAEVYVRGTGWMPVDPADVRKVMLQESPGNLPPSSPIVQRERERLFGSWEMNWVAFNDAQDVVLPGSKGGPLPFFMYPQAENAQGRLDCLDPETFRYHITARQL